MGNMSDNKEFSDNCVLVSPTPVSGIGDEDDVFGFYIPYEIFHEIFVWFIHMSHPAFYKRDLMSIMMTCNNFKLVCERIIQNEEKYLHQMYHSKMEPFRMNKKYYYPIGETDYNKDFTAKLVLKSYFEKDQLSVDILSSRDGAFKIRQAAFQPKHRTNVGYTRFGDYDGIFESARVSLLSEKYWNVVTFTYDNRRREMKVFFNDKLMGQKVFRNVRLCLGYLGGPYARREPQYSFLGPLMEVTLWNRCLKDEEVRKTCFDLPCVVGEKQKEIIASWFFQGVGEEKVYVVDRAHGKTIEEMKV